MSGFTKLSSTLTASSIWNEPDDVRIVFVTMLSLADSDGVVRGSVGGLAHLARKSQEATLRALTVLEAPDPDSTRKELEGRRIIVIEGGWKLVNHSFYRELGMSASTRAYWREKKRAQRQAAVSPLDSTSRSEQKQSHIHTVSEMSETVKDTKQGNGFEEFWQAYPRKVKKVAAEKAFAKLPDPPATLPLILNALKWQCFTTDWTKDSGQFIPHPSTYINNRQWEDEPQKGRAPLTDADHRRGFRSATP